MTNISFSVKFRLGQIVYHVADDLQSRLVIVGYKWNVQGITYLAADSTSEREFYDFELSPEKLIL